MVCIYCSGATQVSNSRRQVRANSVWRRRRCLACKAVFSTVEQADLSTSIAVIDQKGHVIPFSREKLLMSIVVALRDNNKQLEHSTQLCQTVIAKLLKLKTAKLSSQDVLSTTAKTLKNFNHQAYARYLAEYDSRSVKAITS